ncbi:MAG TPA: hypothetical protein VKM94_19670 [Blastocatellia bacterium]|nr:hypothetical protein [Blastocatellia bacterium]
MRALSIRRVFSALLAALLITASVLARTDDKKSDTDSSSVDPKVFERLEWRSIGPCNMGGRVADVEGVPGNPNIVYVGTASGGVFKTINGGTTWTPIFERQGTISVGDIAVQANNPDVVWVGTGESNTRNSVSFGDGVYRSNDGGKTWQHMGLRDTQYISRVVIHPTNPDIVYVAAVGHAFGTNEERGVFMTVDGGRTWQKTLYIDSEHGACDLELDPNNPNVVYAAMWKFQRKPWTFTSGSEKGGLFKSLDGGRTWKQLTNGLPRLIGRIGVRVAPTNSNVVYTIAETKEGMLYRSDDGGETFKQVNKDSRIVSRGFYYSRVRVDPSDENRVYAVASTLFVSIDGGKTFRSITGRVHIDYHAFWVDPRNPNRMWVGEDGGIAVSYDRGEKWEAVYNFPAGQYYQIYADNRQPFYWVSGGLQDNGSWTGPSRSREPGGIMNDDWTMISFGDGFWALNNADDPDLYLSESQGGEVVRTNFRTREQQQVRPYAEDSGGRPAADVRYRFNWNSPLLGSPHNNNTVYLGGNVVFKSTDFGKTWERISPDLTTNDSAKQQNAGGPIAFENSTAEYHCTIISLAESPARAGMIWAGTDDGNLQLTTDGGKKWSNLIRNVPNLPANSSVSHVEPSRTNPALAYASFDRHMFDDFKPHVYKTTDTGRTWTDITGNLPDRGWVHVVREDPKNPNLVYVGTELGLFASYSAGGAWIPLESKNLPHVAVHDIVVHPRDNDLILATHGRSVWIMDDITSIQQMDAAIASQDIVLFDTRPALRFTQRFQKYGTGDKQYFGPNPPYGAIVTYYLKDKPDDKTDFKLQVMDSGGKVIREVKTLPRDKGINRTSWDLRAEGPRVRRPPTDEEAAFFGGPTGPRVMPGTYTIRLTLGSKTVEKKVEVRLDPTISMAPSELQEQFEQGLKLRDMQSTLTDGARLLDSIKEQLKNIEKTVKDRLPDPPAELTKAISDGQKQVDDVLKDLFNPQEPGLGLSGNAKLGDRLGSLARTIDGVNAGPTPAQREYFSELQKEFPSRVDEVNKFISEAIPKLNETLRKHNAPTVMGGKPLELSR